MKLAYRVPCDDFHDDGTTIEFMKLQSQENCENGGYVRAPEFDQYAEQGWIPPSVMLATDWCLYCDECDRRSDEDEDPIDPEDCDTDELREELEYDRLRGPVEHHEHGQWYFCSAYCKAEFLASMESARMSREGAGIFD